MRRTRSTTRVLLAVMVFLNSDGSAADSRQSKTNLKGAGLPVREKPPVQASWSYNIGSSEALNGGATPTGQVISLDLYAVTQATITRLRGRGKYVVCYYSAGTSERYRTDPDSLKLLDPALNRPLAKVVG
ncbi:endo alpha-1,4 polygalactosaminidase [Deinococcus hopiensis]|uniref:Uncharacterized conserved protein n=1 Tax=Deinococcus hopiensis KR-140 TaxID=695939 RepID=A0A1W1UNR2_9DEIO|nr:endo alpha-1,4 polygalactosaminidase [Deinococcus hopiensis]SMB82727.1 Uncharacterized conserved protein [Deinococcus hopiensis KR-140]